VGVQKNKRSCFWSSVCGRRDLSGGNTSDFHILPVAFSISGDIPEHPHDLKCASASSQPSAWRPLTTAESL